MSGDRSGILVRDVLEFLREVAPPGLAEDWDNVGLLIGDPGVAVQRVMTCLTLTPDVAAEAIREQAELVVTHHPVLFRAVQKLTADSSEGRMLLRLIAAGVSVYCPHTAFDSAADGINQQLAEKLGLREIAPLRPADLPRAGELPAIAAPQHVAAPERSPGGGRWGRLAARVALRTLLSDVQQRLQVTHLAYIGCLESPVERVAVACGSGGEFLGDAVQLGCDVLVTGEARFHTCLEARTLDVALILAGHYATERPGLEQLAGSIGRRFPALTVWASRHEVDPVQWC